MEKTAEQLAQEVKQQFDSTLNTVKGIAEDALGKASKGEEIANGVKEQADDLLLQLGTLKGTVTQLEQQIATERTEQKGEMSAGERFTESTEFKEFAEQNRPRGRVIVDVKDISSLTTDAAGSVGTMIDRDRLGLQTLLPRRRLTIRALLAQGRTNSNAIEYDREKLFVNNAAPVAEGALKPQSEIQFDEATATVRTIAHWMRASVQVLADVPALRSMIDDRLRYGLAYAEEVQLLTGNGTGQNLPGLIPNATPYAAPGGLTASNPLDVMRLMILQGYLAEYAPNGIAMNPIDMAAIEIQKDGNGQYLLGNPQGTLTPTLWNLPVVTTQAIAEDKALVGAFNMAAQIFDRQDATVEVSTEDQDNFVKNKVTIRAEERLALAIYRPQAIIYGDLGRVA